MITFDLAAQRQNGYLFSDFSGSVGATYQPASIADSPYKFDFNLADLSYYITNNIANIQKTAEGRGLQRYINSESKFLHANAQGSLGLMLSLPRKQAINVRYGVRTIGSTGNISPNFIAGLNRFDGLSFVNTNRENESIQFNFGLWQELAFTYAGVLKDDGFHRWKLGATIKGINPNASAWIDANSLDYNIDPTGNALFSRFNIQAGFSESLAQFENFDGNDPFAFPKGTGFKPAADIGIVYERVAYRPSPKDAAGTSLERDITYEFRVGLSLTDLGWMTFDAAAASFISTSLRPSIGATDFDAFFDGTNSFRQLRDSLETILNVDSAPSTYTVSLPTALNLNYDYNSGDNWYINVATQVDLTGLMPVDYRINYPTNITVTPRYETGLKGFYLPIFYNFDGDMEVGMGFRYGPITIGTQSLGGIFAKEKVSGGAFFSINLRQLKANSAKPYCFGSSRTGSAFVRTQRTPIYKRKKFLFF